VLPRLLEPFFTTKAPGKGTGLGLAICFATITEMGGTLTVHNEDGGAVFEIRLPVAETPSLQDRSLAEYDS
jgi:two-component system NtrC family sensor kinase